MQEKQTKLLFRGAKGWIISLVVILTLLAGSTFSLLHFTINNAPEVYFQPDAPAVVFEKELRQRFPTDQTLIALFEGPDLFDSEMLVRLKRVEQRMESMPWSNVCSRY